MILTETTAALLQPYLDKKFHDLEFETYLRTFGASSHGLKDIRRSAKYYRWRRDNMDTSRPMEIGRMTHLLVLERDKFMDCVKVAPDVDGRTTSGKAQKEQFRASLRPNDIEVSSKDYRTLMAIEKSLMEHDFSKKLFKKPNALKEKSAFWIHPETKVFCKIRPDLMFLEGDIIVDVKTTKSVEPSEFARDIYKLGYDIQYAFYKDAYKAITGREPTFFWLCVENSGPHEVVPYVGNDKIYGFGKIRYEKALQTFAECYKSNTWPGIADNLVNINLPNYAETAEQFLEDMHI